MPRMNVHLIREVGTDEMVMINPHAVRFIRGAHDPQQTEIVFSETHSVFVHATLAEMSLSLGDAIGIPSGTDVLGSSGGGTFQREIKS